jgi:hypothetical protein
LQQERLTQQTVEKTPFDPGMPCYYLPSTEEYLLRKELEEAKKENQEFEEMLISWSLGSSTSTTEMEDMRLQLATEELYKQVK